VQLLFVDGGKSDKKTVALYDYLEKPLTLEDKREFTLVPNCDLYELAQISIEGLPDAEVPAKWKIDGQPLDIFCGPEKKINIRLSCQLKEDKNASILTVRSDIRFKVDKHTSRQMPKLDLVEKAKQQDNYKTIARQLRNAQARRAPETPATPEELQGYQGQLNNLINDAKARFSLIWGDFDELAAYKSKLDSASIHFTIVGTIKNPSDVSREATLYIVGNTDQLSDPMK
jgi:hypothetical protein